MDPSALVNLHDEYHSFFMPLYYDRDYVVVPRWFIREHPHVLDAEEVVLFDPSGNFFHVAVRLEPNEVRFQGGFESIRESHQLLGTTFFQFHFVGGTNFDVRIFYHDVAKVDYPEFIPAPPQNEVFVWTADLSSPLCRGNQPLFILVSVVADYLEHRPPTINVKLPNGTIQEWQLIWDRKRTRQCMIGGGWYQFCRAKKFKMDDQLRFFKLPQEDSFKVVVIRH